MGSSTRPSMVGALVTRTARARGSDEARAAPAPAREAERARVRTMRRRTAVSVFPLLEVSVSLADEGKHGAAEGDHAGRPEDEPGQSVAHRPPPAHHRAEVTEERRLQDRDDEEQRAQDDAADSARDRLVLRHGCILDRLAVERAQVLFGELVPRAAGEAALEAAVRVPGAPEPRVRRAE